MTDNLLRRVADEERVRQEGRKVGRFEDGTDRVIGALIEVHRRLGPGLLESVYEACLCAELGFCGLRFARQWAVPVVYRDLRLDCGYRADLVVEDRILVELKAVERLLPIHEAQVVTYLRLARLPVGLLVNFNTFVLKTALRRLTPEHPNPDPKNLKPDPFRPSALPVPPSPSTSRR